MPRSILDQLSEILAKERSAMLAAKFDDVTALGPNKFSLLAAIEESDVSAADLAILKVDIAHNQALLESAISGITHAMKRLADINHVRENLNVYSQDGQLANVPTDRPKLERKA